MPCARETTSYLLLHKSHDARLTDPTNVANGRFLIQTREVAGQIASEIERLKLRNGAWAESIDEPEFAEFWLVTQYLYRRGFERRWVEPRSPASLVIDYEDLAADPEKCLSDAIRWFRQEPNPSRVSKIVAAQKSRLARHPGIDDENLPFRPRNAIDDTLLPGRLMRDYVDLYRTSPSLSRLAEICYLLDDTSAQPPTARALDAIRGFGNRHLTHSVEKSLRMKSRL